MPTPQTTTELGGRTPADFEFSLKLYQKFTHPEMFLKASGMDPVRSRSRVTSTSFARAIDPLADAGKLGALLAQFPASFKNEPSSRGYLEWLLERVPDYPLAVELRHRSCSDEPGETCGCWARTAPRWCKSTSRSSESRSARTAGRTCKTFYYMRLHGRNAAQWWKHDKSEDRYNYLYSASELEPIRRRRATRRRAR